MKIERALISVSDKSGLDDFAKRLHALGVEILSTGGTARFLTENGIPVVDVSDYTGEPELFDGRLKTLHPKVHGGMQFRRDHPEDPKQAEEHGIKVPEGEAYHSIEGANGELGFYVISDGTGRPYRVRCHPPCFPLLASFPHVAEGGMIADAVANLGSLNIIAGELDR